MAGLNEWLSASEAVRVSGLSSRTLKRLAAEKRIKFSRSPGGHLRFARVDVERIHSTSEPAAAPASTVLQNKKERVEELVLETQELRARRELDRIHEEDADRKRERAETRRAEMAARALELQKSKAQEKRDAERREHERRDAEAERRQREFERRYVGWATDRLPEWLSFEQRQAVLQMVEEMVRARTPEDESTMQSSITDAMARLCAPWAFERRVQAKREEMIEETLRRLPHGATDAEMARAATDVRAAISQIPLTANDLEVRVVVSIALEITVKAIRQRLASEEAVAKEKQARERAESERVKSEEIRELRKICRVAEALKRVDTYISELFCAGEIGIEDYSDSAWRAELKDLVREELEDTFTFTGASDETREDAEAIAQEIVNEELE